MATASDQLRKARNTETKTPQNDASSTFHVIRKAQFDGETLDFNNNGDRENTSFNREKYKLTRGNSFISKFGFSITGRHTEDVTASERENVTECAILMNVQKGRRVSGLSSVRRSTMFHIRSVVPRRNGAGEGFSRVRLAGDVTNRLHDAARHGGDRWREARPKKDGINFVIVARGFYN